MDEDIRGCQNQLSMENCTTKQYLETLQTQCGCIPFNIKILKKVSQSKQLIFYYLIKLIYSLQDLPSCTTEIQHECLQKISLDTYNCKKSCNGLLITSFSKTEFDKNLERHIPKALNAYRKYKKMFQYNPIMEGMKHLINIVIISTFPLFYMQNMCGKTS